MLDRERPAKLTGTLVAQVKPNPWVHRAGHGRNTRIRIDGRHRYERNKGEAIWTRVEDRSDLSDLGDFND